MSRHPEVKWAQRSDKVYLTILLADTKNVQINLEPDGVFTFSGIAGSDNILYELKLELYDKVNVETSKLNAGVRSIFCVINKAENGWWKKLLRGDGKLPHYIKVDWDKWVDADDGLTFVLMDPLYDLSLLDSTFDLFQVQMMRNLKEWTSRSWVIWEIWMVLTILMMIVMMKMQVKLETMRKQMKQLQQQKVKQRQLGALENLQSSLIFLFMVLFYCLINFPLDRCSRLNKTLKDLVE